MKKILLIILLFPTACKSKNEKKPIILSMKEMSDLATVEYTVSKIIRAEDNKTWFKIGDRKILMSCEATIKAGVDLNSISEDDFRIAGKDIKIQLPAPKVISVSLPPEKIKVEYQDVGMFRDAFKTGERDQLAAQAERQIKSSIDSLGILNQAKANTSLFVRNMLQQLGYENITITFRGSSFVNPMQ
jgi:hypothetical protein